MSPRRTTVLIAVLAVLALTAGGCSSGEEFPTGRWRYTTIGDFAAVIDYREDGTYSVMVGLSTLQMQAYTSGTYEVSGDELVFRDGTCGTIAGTYTWELDGDELRLTVVDDACEDRRGPNDGAVLVAMDTAQGGPASADPVADPASWWNERTFYEVFVRSFSDSDGDGNGDLQGLIDRLDYLNDGDPATTDDLGVTGVWLMPVSQSPSYHGYDTTDYRTIEADYGTNEDFKAFVEAAHERGIAVVVDLMLNHTSNEHPWFVEAESGPDAERRDWYIWSATDTGQLAPWGTPVWHPGGGGYYLGLFWEGMPDLNYRNDAVTQQMYDVARFWMEDMGVDGFRLDAVRHLIEEEGSVSGTPETHAWLSAWDDHLDSVDPQFLTVGEVWDDTPMVAPYVVDDEVDIAFEFAIANGILSSVQISNPNPFANALSGALAAYPAGQFAPFLTNHDQDRVMSQLGDTDKAELAATAMLTLPGVPFVYYGEEIGMVGAKPDERIRTPMQWDGSTNAGFTSGQPWEPLNADAATVNVAAQQADPESLWSHYRALIAARADHAALRTGGLQSLEAACETGYAFTRSSTDGSDNVLVVLNFSGSAQQCAFSADATGVPEGEYAAVDLLTGQAAADLSVGRDGAISDYEPADGLQPRQGLVLELQATG
jgi:alpha-amylase